MITVACVFVHGHVAFTSEYVVRLQSMVARHLDRPFRFVCLTDMPHLLPWAMEKIQIPTPRDHYGWWSKMYLWTPGIFSGRVLYLDLDTLVVANLAPIVDYPAPFALIPDGAPNFIGKGRLLTVKRFNSSVMVFDADCRPQLAQAWTDEAMARLWGDQDLIGEVCPNEATMPLDWFPRISAVNGPPWPAEAKVVLMKKPKNAAALRMYDWMAEWWT